MERARTYKLGGLNKDSYRLMNFALLYFIETEPFLKLMPARQQFYGQLRISLGAKVWKRLAAWDQLTAEKRKAFMNLTIKESQVLRFSLACSQDMWTEEERLHVVPLQRSLAEFEEHELEPYPLA